MQLGFINSVTSVVLRLKFRKLSDGTPFTTLDHTSVGLILAAIADNEAATTAYTVAGSTIETITTLGTFAAPTATKCRFKAVDATNHPGLYEVQLADARWAVSGARSVNFTASGVSDLESVDTVIQLGQVTVVSGASAMTESYRATAQPGTLAQLLYEILQNIVDHAIVGTTKTAKKIDGTTAKVYTLNDATNPTSITELS